MQVLRPVRTAAATTMAACLLLAGCTTEADPSPSPSPASQPSASSSAPGDPSTGPVTLRLGVYGDRPLRRGFVKLARMFADEHPDVTVQVDYEPNQDVFAASLRREFAAGDPPDLFIASSAMLPQLSALDRVQPVDGLLEARGFSFGDNYQRLVLEALSAEQALQCMPYDVSPLVVLYNQELVPFQRLVEDGEDRLTPETGWTWDQFEKAVRLMSHHGVNGVYADPRLATLMALVRSAGEDIVDDPRDATTLTLEDDGTRDALEQILDLLREPRYTPSRQRLAKTDPLTLFEQGRIGMLLASRDVVPELRKADNLDFDVFPLPRLGRTRTVADVTGLCLSADTEHVEAAADFLAFATGPKGAEVLAETGEMVPAHLPTLNSPAFVQPGLQPESVDVFGAAVAHAGVTPYVVGWPDLVDATEADLRQMFYAPVIDLDTLLPRMDERSREILVPLEAPSAATSASPSSSPTG